MADPARRRAIYSDLKGIPDHVVAEILDGELSLEMNERAFAPDASYYANTPCSGRSRRFRTGRAGGVVGLPDAFYAKKPADRGVAEPGPLCLPIALLS